MSSYLKFRSLESLQGREKWKFHSLGSPHRGEKWKFPSLGSPHGGGKWKFLAWEASRGKSENSVAWEAPTGGKSENSLAWEASTGGKSENSRLGSLYGGEKWKLLSLGSPNWKHCRTWCFRPVLWRQKCKVPCFEGNHCKNMETHSKNTGFGGLSRRRCLAIWNSAALQYSTPPLAPLTDRNKPAVWAATPREAGWIGNL